MTKFYSGEGTDPRQLLKVVRERFGRTFGIKDGHRRIRQRYQREAHRHPVVVIGADFCVLQLCRRGDADIIFPLFHLGAHFTQLGRHGEQTVRLLDPPVVDIAQGSGPLREQRGGGDGHRGVRDMVHIHIDRRGCRR